MMDIHIDHFDDIHHEEMMLEMYVEKQIVRYHLEYDHCLFDQLVDVDDDDWTPFSYLLISLFAIRHSKNSSTIRTSC